MTYSRATLVVLFLCLFVAASVAQQKVKIVGVWEMVSAKNDGKEVFQSGRQVKTITKTRFVFIYQDKDKVLAALAKKTQQDTLDAYAGQFGAGSGTYKLIGNTYTETIDFMQNVEYVGLSIPFTVKVEGNRFYQSGKFPVMEGGKKVKEVLLEEVYKRIE
jgi:hypothetical protein